MSADDHGQASTYVNHGCRCDDCRDAHTSAQAVYEAKRQRRLQRDPDAAPHGCTSTYDNWRCRCGECREAHARRAREYRRGRAS